MTSTNKITTMDHQEVDHLLEAPLKDMTIEEDMDPHLIEVMEDLLLATIEEGMVAILKTEGMDHLLTEAMAILKKEVMVLLKTEVMVHLLDMMIEDMVHQEEDLLLEITMIKDTMMIETIEVHLEHLLLSPLPKTKELDL